LYGAILSKAVSVGVGNGWTGGNDLLNILQASLKAMALAIHHLSIPPDFYPH